MSFSIASCARGSCVLLTHFSFTSRVTLCCDVASFAFVVIATIGSMLQAAGPRCLFTKLQLHALLLLLNTHTHIQRTSLAPAAHFTMVHYPLPKHIKKTHMRGQRDYRWSAAEQQADINALIATCTRCVQTIADQKERCNKPAHRRCDHCADGNRGGCTLVSFSLQSCAPRALLLIPTGAFRAQRPRQSSLHAQRSP